MKVANTNKQSPLNFNFYWLINLILAGTGLISSTYLSISHYRVYTDVGYRSFCSISKAINCDTVSQSQYSVFLGIPLGLWGCIGYLAVIVLLFFAKMKAAKMARVWTTIFIITCFYSIISVFLALISDYLIHSYCIICITTYAVNFLLLYFSWLTNKRFEHNGFVNKLRKDIIYFKDNRRNLAISYFPLILFVVALIIFLPPYWTYSFSNLAETLPHGITKDGYPWIGAINPSHTIIEFEDYQCFQCKKMHFFLRSLVEKYPKKLRLVQRQFPMDRNFNVLVKDNFHQGSGKMALLAIYAIEKNKFWKMNDILFQLAGTRTTINLKELSEKTGINANGLAWALTNKQVYYRLFKDIKDGINLGIVGTPSFVIDGHVYQATIPPDVLKKLLR